MKYSVYVLKSLKNAKRYIGLTSKDPKVRLVEHNNGLNKFTSANRPWILVYFEKDYCKECAQKREKFLKSGQGRKILGMIDDSLVSAKGGSASG